MLNVSHLSFARGNKLVLKDINLSIGNSEVLVIKGSNGIGKSTFLSCMAGFLEPLEGTVEYFSKSIDPTISAKNFIFVGEENFAYEDLSILDNIYYTFAVDGALAGGGGLSYSEVDMNLDGGLGDINANKNIMILQI